MMAGGRLSGAGGAAYQKFRKTEETKSLTGKEPEDFADGLLSFCNRPGLAVKGFFCPCCVAAENSAETLRHDYNCEFLLYCCCYPCVAPSRRGEYRRKYRLQASSYDCLTHCICPCCAICQERRHVLMHPSDKERDPAPGGTME
mmetsp:Transcript_4661/g.6596  ORF Transcript_4661/g.6596 Transcript_4661/m.6596 type:complete len:144 (-) Transcript_4661:252-683(-)